MDDLKLRKETANWREYLAETRESVRVLGWVWRELINRTSHRWARLMLFLSALSLMFGLAMPWLMHWLIDALVTRDLPKVVWSLTGVGLTWLLSLGFGWALMRAREYMFGENVIEVDSRTAEMFFDKSLGQHLRDNSVLSVGNLEKGRGRIYGIMEALLFNAIDGLIKVLLCFGFVWFLSWIAGLVITAIMVLFLVSSLVINRQVIIKMDPVDLEFRRLNRHRCERWDKIERVKACGKEAEESSLMRGWVNRIIRDDRRFWLWFINVISLRGVIEALALVGLIIFGAVRVWDGVWTVGLLYPLISWSRQFSENLWRIGQAERQINAALPSVRSLMRALTIEPDIRDRDDAIELDSETTPRLALESVDHAYRKETINEDDDDDDEDGQPDQSNRFESQQILNRVDFAIEPGQRVALIGPSGAGKTTVMRLIQRYFDPTSGRVTVDGHDLRDLKLSSWQRLVSYVAQQPQVMDGTIRSNLLYGLDPAEREKVTDDQLWALVRRLKIDFGERLTDGLDTKVGPRGIKLSGGEQQRLMIGAAAMKRPRFWIIDEATSSLDSTTEKAVQLGLTEVMEEGTSALIIAHRLSTVRHICDRFVVLSQNGHGSKVESIGESFEELYRTSPTFRQLADDQDLVIADVTDTAAESAGLTKKGQPSSGTATGPSRTPERAKPFPV